jgi:hypothetical protein
VSSEEISARIEEICSFEGRLAGTDAERRLANRLSDELGSATRSSVVEPIWVQPQWAIVHLLHCLLAIAGSVLAPSQPAVGFAIVLAAATSAYLDLSGRWYLIRRLLFRRASQNVHVSGGDRLAAADAPRVILCANLDAPRTGAAYNRLPTRLLERASRRFPVMASPTRIWFWSIGLLLIPIGARMAGADATWLDLVQLAPTLILIVACFLLGEIALSPASPGANSNASGVAAAIESLRLLDADPTAARRRVVVALDAPDGDVEVRDDLDRGVVRLQKAVTLAQIASVHVDDAEAEDSVAAAAAAVIAADLGDQAAQDRVDDAEGYELSWYASQELADLLGSL